MTNRLPDDVLSRLRRAEARQRLLTLSRNLPAERIDVLAIWTGLCGCGCGQSLDVSSRWNSKHPPPLYPVIAHVLARGSKGGHTRDNVSIWAWACNRREALHEASEAASVKRFAVQKGRPKSGKIRNRGFQKGHRPIPSRPFFKKS